MEILFVEDQPLISEPTAQKLKFNALVGQIEIARDAATALRLIKAFPEKWDLILLDLDVPGAIGLSLAMEIAALDKAGITCIITGYSRHDYVAQAKAHGFLGYILKTSEVQVLDATLGKILAGESAFPETPEGASGDVIRLTALQKEKLLLMAEGLNTKQIARKLKVHPSTVSYHLDSAFKALGVKSRVQAVHKAAQLGLINLNFPIADLEGEGDEEE